MDSNVFNAVKTAFAKAMVDCALASNSPRPLGVLNFKFFSAESMDELRDEVTDEAEPLDKIEKVLPEVAHGATHLDVLNYLVAKNQ
jgi:hypothetical protein